MSDLPRAMETKQSTSESAHSGYLQLTYLMGHCFSCFGKILCDQYDHVIAGNPFLPFLVFHASTKCHPS